MAINKIGLGRMSKIERQLSRRDFIRAAARLSAASVILIGPHAWAARAAMGEGKSKRLVVVFMRGAVDGLNVVVPYGAITNTTTPARRSRFLGGVMVR